MDQQRWVVGAVGDLSRVDGVVALDLHELRAAAEAGADAGPIHELGEIEPREEVVVSVPRWRGHSFIAYLEWLVCARLAADGARVTWLAERRGGEPGLRRLLTERGWAFEVSKQGRQRVVVGTPPPAGPEPEPRGFEEMLGGRRMRFAADWGVFSEGAIDAGTRLLFDVASSSDVDVVLDVGTGYGPLALGLLAGGHARRAVATDTDSVALLLARRNAEASDLSLETHLTEDHTRVGPADLVVCNFPTHAGRTAADALIAALVRLAATARVLVVVHESLADRYTTRFEAASGAVKREATGAHTVLGIRSTSSSR